MSRKRHLILLGVLLFAQLAVVSVQVRGDASQPSGSGGFLFQVFGPVAKIGSGTIGGIGDLWTNYVDLRGARDEAAELAFEAARLRMELDAMKEVARQNERLQRLLSMKQQHEWDEIVAANVVALHREPTAGTMVLNRGRRHGIRPNLPVVTADGVVGRVVSVGPGTAKVQLLTDPSAGVAVVFERSRDHASGVAAGGQGDQLEVRYVSNLTDVVEGDLARTSGLDGIYPRGLPVGVVSKVRNRADLMKEIQLSPSVPFRRLEEVLVLLEPAQLADSGEEPASAESEEATVARR